MEKPKQPERHSELHDPKLPVVNGGACGNRAEGRVRRNSKTKTENTGLL